MNTPNRTPPAAFPASPADGSWACAREPHEHISLMPGLEYCLAAKVIFACPVKMECPSWVYAGPQDADSLARCMANIVTRLLPNHDIKEVVICSREDPH